MRKCKISEKDLVPFQVHVASQLESPDLNSVSYPSLIHLPHAALSKCSHSLLNLPPLVSYTINKLQGTEKHTCWYYDLLLNVSKKSEKQQRLRQRQGYDQLLFKHLSNPLFKSI